MALETRENEEALLGAIIANPGSFASARLNVSSDDFFNVQNRAVWDAISSLYDKGSPIDYLTVETEAKKGDVGITASFLTSLLAACPSVVNADEYARAVKDMSIRRSLLAHASAIATQASNLEHPTEDTISNIRLAADALSRKNASSIGAIKDAGDVAIDFLEVLSDVGTAVVKVHIPKIDWAVGGFEHGALGILASRPSMGKSTLAFQWACNIAAHGQKVMYFSLEMTAKQLWARRACGNSGVEWRSILRGVATEEEKQKVIDSTSELVDIYGKNLLVDDRTQQTVESIWALASVHKPCVVIVDVLQLLKDKEDNEVQRLGKIAYGLKAMAKDVKCHVVGVTHVNRASETNEKHIPTMSDLKSSGDLEQAADYVLLLHSDDYYKELAPGTTHLKSKVIVAKNRDGVRNQHINLWFDLKKQWFLDEDPNYIFGGEK